MFIHFRALQIKEYAMQNINSIKIIGILGYLTRVPVSTKSPFKEKSTTLSISVNIGTKNDPHIQWHTVKFFGEKALAAAKLKLGDAIEITGQIIYRTEKKRNQQDRILLEVHGQDYSVLPYPVKTINQVNILGTLATDPDLKYFENRPKAVLSIATTSGTGESTTTELHTVVFWDENVKLVSTLKSGDMVDVTGSSRYRTWIDHGSKQKRFSPEIHAEQCHVIREQTAIL